MSHVELNILAFGPHPDDVEFFCSGLLIKMAAKGYKTGVVDLTEGELSSRGTLATRRKETAAATQVLSLAHRENLALPDGCLDPYSRGEAGDSQLVTVVDALRRLRPELVLIPHEKGRHPDHTAAHTLLSRAIFFAGLTNFAKGRGKPFTPLQVFSYQMRYEFKPSFIVDISDHFEYKRKAILCYVSQIERKRKADPEPETLVSSPLSISSIEARDGHLGAMIGVKYGEAYLSSGAVCIDDPVKHFRSHPAKEILYYPVSNG